MSCSSVQRGTRFVTGAQLNGKVAHRLRHLGKIFHMFPPSGHQEGQKTAFRGWTDRKGKRGSRGHREVVLGAASHSHSRVHTALPGVPGRTELRKGPSSVSPGFLPARSTARRLRGAMPRAPTDAETVSLPRAREGKRRLSPRRCPRHRL